MFSLKEIINSKKQIVWTQRDLWPILGLLHYKILILKIIKIFFLIFDRLIRAYKLKIIMTK